MSDIDDKIEFPIEDTPKVEAKNDDQPVVEIVDEPVTEGNVEAVEGDDKPDYDPEKALRKLQKKLEKERKARADAERMAREAAEHARMAQNEVSDSNLHLVSGAMDSIRRDQEILKAHIRDAMTIGDYEKVADLQEQMATNITNLRQLERGYEEMKQQPRFQPQPMPRTELSVDNLIDQVTPKSAEWLKRNREHLPDERSIRVMARAHEDAVDFGIAPESDAYFKFVENRLGISSKSRSIPEVDNVMSGASEAKPRRSAPPSAPVSRHPPDSPNRHGVIRLTPAEVEAAEFSGLTPQQYYENKMRDQRQRMN